MIDEQEDDILPSKYCARQKKTILICIYMSYLSCSYAGTTTEIKHVLYRSGDITIRRRTRIFLDQSMNIFILFYSPLIGEIVLSHIAHA
jgi:hypothetical protein